MLAKILEMKKLLSYSDWEFTDWEISRLKILTGVHITEYPPDYQKYKAILQKKLSELLDSPVSWYELMEVLENMKVDLERLS